ncbi:MAG: type I DNA topoisomerase [Anaerolineae bacterium]|nr:type I DNA topoisomerase [Anaerolineae bacterium]
MSDNTMQAYCMKCKTKRDIQNPEATYTKAGTPATKGVCPVCGTKMFRMGKTDAHANVPKPEVIAKPKKSTKASKKKKDTKGKGRKTKAKKAKTRRKNVGKLVIVESPAKARSIGSYLGKGYTVMASKGHVRDLLKSQLSVDVEQDFEPRYRVPNDKRAIVKELKAAVEGAEVVYLATDPDREGEAIAWHLMAAAEIPTESAKRVVFHEITKDTVKDAFNHPREIDINLVNAQQARRILDRLVGYKLTRLLWEKVRNYLSAGRVQSVALRLVVEREREIEAFVAVEYWTIEAELSKQAQNGEKPEVFKARLAKIDGEDFDLNSEADVELHIRKLEQSEYHVSAIKKGTRQRKPSPPFTTSSLQQEASRRLGFSTRRTMRAAQQLYEGIELGDGEVVGLITYMRTDSLHISESAQNEARDYITKNYSQDHMPKSAPKYKTKAKGAQEAHEAIRPTGVLREPRQLESALLGVGKKYNSRSKAQQADLYKLYELIWQRFVASQMSNAVYDTLRVEIVAGPSQADRPYLFRASGSRLKFAGFLALYEDSKDEDDIEESDEGRIFPEMTVDEVLRLLKLLPDQHFTQPPPRYTEASLVRILEEYGIGRPSTYAPTVAVIQDRDYVNKENKRLIPSDIGKVVSDLLVQYFPQEFDYEFTARMEDKLDDIADNDGVWAPMLHEFYNPFTERLDTARNLLPEKQEEKVGRICPTCETGDLVVKYGRFGKFIGCSNYPDCTHREKIINYAGVLCPQCGEEHGGELVIKKTSKQNRTFYGCSRYPDCDYSTWKLPQTEDSADKGQEVEAQEKIKNTG